MEALEFKQVNDVVFTHVGSVLSGYLPVLQWFDVFRVRKKILAAMSTRIHLQLEVRPHQQYALSVTNPYQICKTFDP